MQQIESVRHIYWLKRLWEGDSLSTPGIADPLKFCKPSTAVPAGSFESQDLLSRLQGQPPNAPVMDPIVSLISAVQMNQGSQGSSMAPIGYGAAPHMPYQSPLGPGGAILPQQNPGSSVSIRSEP